MSDLVDRIMNKLAGLNDLVKRLRTPCSDIGINEELIDAQRNDAADEIERLRGVLRFWQEEFAKQFSDLHDERERLRARLAEANELAGLGCDANNRGAHSIVKVKNYSFCHKCGETMRDIPMRERARIAEARLADVERERDALIQTTEANFRQWGAATAQSERLEAALTSLLLPGFEREK